MGRQQATADIHILRGIVASLMGMAVLAELVSTRSFHLRWFILTLLRRGEAVSQSVLADISGTTLPPSFEPPDICFGPSDALLLAARLRVLARAIAAMLHMVCGRACSFPDDDNAFCLVFADIDPTAFAVDTSGPTFFDTS